MEKVLESRDLKEEDKEWVKFLETDYIRPLKKLGFEFEGYNHAFNNETCQGVHCLLFNSKNAKWTDEIDKLMVQDDSQPKPIYSIYFGTLWVFLPYCG